MSIVALKRKSKARNVPKFRGPKQVGKCCTMKGAYESDYISSLMRMKNLVKREIVKAEKDTSGEFNTKIKRIGTCENKELNTLGSQLERDPIVEKCSSQSGTVKVNTNYNRRLDTVQYPPLIETCANDFPKCSC